MTTTYTIITTEAILHVDADRYRRSEDGDLYCYVDDDGDVLANGDSAIAHVDNSEFVAIVEDGHGEYQI